jgi:hypothetical protein
MNEFTKEELKIIYRNLCVNDKTQEILKKIEQLHQNYCEHNWDTVCQACPYENVRCTKCNIYILP